MIARISLVGHQRSGWALLIMFLALTPAAVRSQVEYPATMPASLAETVQQRLPESKRYSALASLYERRLAQEGEAWVRSATGRKLLATLDRLHSEAATASTATANQRLVTFTAGGRVSELGLGAANPDTVDSDEKYRWDTAGMIAGLILNRASDDGLLLPAPLTPAAQEAIDRGIESAKAADYLQALKHFEKARALSPFPSSPLIYFNLGLAESKLPGRELRAIAWFGAYLTANPYAAAPNEPAVLEQMIALFGKNRSNLLSWLQTVQDAAGKGSPYDQLVNWRRMVSLRSRAGDIAGAQVVAALIPDSDDSSFAYHDILQAQLKAGDIPGAQKTVRIIEERLTVAIASKEVATSSGYAGARTSVAFTLAEAQTELAEAKIMAGDIAGAKKDLAAAQRSAALIRYATYESIVQPAIAEALINAGELDRAKVVLAAARITVDHNPEPNAKISELLGIARAQLRAGDTAGATQTFSFARDVARSAGWSQFAGQMAVAQARGGDMPGALSTIGQIVDNTNIDQALIAIAEAQAKRGDFEGASTTAGKIMLWELGKSRTQLAIAEAKGNHGTTVTDWLRVLTDSNDSHVCALNSEFFTDYAAYLNSRRKLLATAGLANNTSGLYEELRGISDAKIDAHNAIGHMLNSLAGKCSSNHMAE